MFDPISNLPWPWEAVYDERYGIYYYWNYWTGESQWKKPKSYKRSARLYSPPKRDLEDPSNLYEAIAEELSYDTKQYIKLIYPDLEEKDETIVNDAIEKSKQEYLTLFGGFSRRRAEGQDARDVFLQTTLDAIKTYQQNMLKIFEAIMLSKQRPLNPEATDFSKKLHDKLESRPGVLTGKVLLKKFKKSKPGEGELI
uniref:WW domain-containing protein n=1 Tax=viral metagenome TaxID=1070528 RepID=A0A6C0H336_9ZZZZ